MQFDQMGDYDDGSLASNDIEAGNAGMMLSGGPLDGMHGPPILPDGEDELYHNAGVHGGVLDAEQPEDAHHDDMFARIQAEEEAKRQEERKKEAIRIAREERKI